MTLYSGNECLREREHSENAGCMSKSYVAFNYTKRQKVEKKKKKEQISREIGMLHVLVDLTRYSCEASAGLTVPVDELKKYNANATRDQLSKLLRTPSSPCSFFRFFFSLSLPLPVSR